MSSPRGRLLISVCLLSVGMTACGSAGGTHAKLLVITPNPALTAPALPRFNAPCHAPPESGTARSDVVFSGPCNVRETAAVRCERQADDFYVDIHRKFIGGWRFDVYINVEYYHGPDTYKNKTDLYIQVSKGQTIDAWGQHFASTTVTPEEHSLIMPATKAPGYAGVVQVEPETVSGTFVCQSHGTKTQPK